MNAPEPVAAVTPITFAMLPAVGTALGGGIFVGLTTDKHGQHFAVALLADKPEKDLTWKDARAWADSVGGVLPTRPVGALLFANAKDQFDDDEWHWMSEEYSGSSAWYQFFDYGSQDYNRKDNTLRCRAVRLIQLTA